MELYVYKALINTLYPELIMLLVNFKMYKTWYKDYQLSYT